AGGWQRVHAGHVDVTDALPSAVPQVRTAAFGVGNARAGRAASIASEAGGDEARRLRQYATASAAGARGARRQEHASSLDRLRNGARGGARADARAPS